MNIIEVLQKVLNDMLGAVPGIIGALVITILGIVISKVVSNIIRKALEKAKVDDLADKFAQIEFVAQYDVKIKPSVIVGAAIYYMMMLVFLIAATTLLGMPIISQLISDIINYIPNIISALIVTILGLVLADAVQRAVLNTCKSLGIPSAKVIANLIFYFIFLTILVTALGQAKIDTDFIKSNLSIILGGTVAAFAVGYGLASRDLMSNFLASFYSKNKFQIGDKITVDNVTGIIVDIDNSAIMVESEDKMTVIPLNQLTNRKVDIWKN